MLHLITNSQSHYGPGLIFRSALFNARNKNRKRKYIVRQEITLIGEGSITYTGEELSQDDETVWLQILHLALAATPTDHAAFSDYSILKAMNWPTTVFYYKKLDESINSLVATHVTIESRHLCKPINCSLIQKYEKFQNGKWHVWIEKEILSLFYGNRHTQAEWKQRLKLPCGMATWLHIFLLHHHEKLEPLNIDLLAKAAGLNAKKKQLAKDIIKDALQNLVGVGYLKSWSIENNSLRVEFFL